MSSWVINLIREEDGSLIETVRIPGYGRIGREIVRRYGQETAEVMLRDYLIEVAEGVLKNAI